MLSRIVLCIPNKQVMHCVDFCGLLFLYFLHEFWSDDNIVFSYLFLSFSTSFDSFWITMSGCLWVKWVQMDECFFFINIYTKKTMAWGTINEISEVQLQCNGTLLVRQLTCRSNIIRPTFVRARVIIEISFVLCKLKLCARELYKSC